MDTDVGIIIVSFRSREDIAACLASIGGAQLRARVVVVDNASHDGTAELVQRSFPEVTLLSSSRNIGFAAACNTGVRASIGKYCLFLNPDVRLSGDAVEALVRFAEENPKVGIVGPQVFNEDGRTLQLSCRSFPTIGSLFFNRFSLLSRVFPNNRWSRRYLLLTENIADPRAVDWVSGCCMLVRREALDSLQGFDEQFFLYSEDVDLCLRARHAGWQTCYEPRTHVIHRIGASSGGLRPIIERHRSVWRYYKKHMANGQKSLGGLVFLAIAVRCSALILASLVAGVSERLFRLLGPCREGMKGSGGVAES